jgi:predicted nucleic acid-binding protein
MIEKNSLYPISCLRGLKRTTKTKLVNKGIVLMKQVLEENPSTLARKTGIPKEAIRQVITKAETIMTVAYKF